jgi:anti-sigma factor RsiW
MSSIDPVAQLSDHDLHAFVDGELDGRRYRQVVAHLANDPAAAERVNGYLRQQGEFAALRELLADADPVEHEATADLARQLASQIRRQRRVRNGMIGAAMAATVLVGIVTWWGPNPGEVAQHFATWRQVAELEPHVLFGRDPLNGVAQLVAGGNNEVSLKLDEQLAAYSIRRPDLAAHGLKFVGGDALKGGDSPAIRLVYADDADRRVFLFIGMVGSSADAALTVVPEDHVSLNWRRGPLVFALIGPKDSEQLLDVMAVTSELLSMPPADGSTTPPLTTPGPSASSTTPPTTEEGLGQLDGSTGLVSPPGGNLAVTPEVAEPL